MTRRTFAATACPILIVAIAAFFRFFRLTVLPPGLHIDEAMNGNNALEALATGSFKLFYPENNGREGLFINLQAIAIAFLGNDPWVLRSVSALFGTGTVVGTYFLARMLYRERMTAIFAALFLAVSFWHVALSRVGFRAIAAPFFLVWSLYFLLSAFPKKRSAIALLAGIVYGLGLHTYAVYRASILIMAVPLIRARKQRMMIGLFLLGAAISAAPLAFSFLNGPAALLTRFDQVSIFNSVTPVKDIAFNAVAALGMFHIAGDTNWRFNISGAPQLSPLVGLFLLFGIVRFIAESRSGKEDARWTQRLLLAWMAIGLLPSVVTTYAPHALRSILVIPAVMLISAAGASWVYAAIEKKIAAGRTGRLLATTAACMAIFMAAKGYSDYFVVWANEPLIKQAFLQRLVDIGASLRVAPAEPQKFVIVDRFGSESTWAGGLPMYIQPVLFMSDTYGEAQRREKNVHYVFREQAGTVPLGAIVIDAAPY